jgi:hypothetical protein
MSPAMADDFVPNFKHYAEGEEIPPVDPEDLRRRWQIPIPWSRDALETAWKHEADISAVSSREQMIRTLVIYKLLRPWQRGEKELDDAVFRIAATFPLRQHGHKNYMIPGDERFGFDPNVFVQRLIEETGISHVWEPVPTKISEGRAFSWSLVGGAKERDPDAAAKQGARQILWELWKRFSPSLDEIVSHSDKEQATHIVATFFANFLLDNVDLVRQLEDAFKDMQHIPLDPILTELEQRAQGRV